MSHTFDRTIGSWGNRGNGFSHPVDVAVDDTGLLHVLNRSTSWDAPHGRAVRVSVVDPHGDVLREIGERGEQVGALMMPTAVAVTTDAVIVADEHTHRVTVFDQDGQVRSHWGGHGTAAGQFDRPSGLVCLDDTVAVVDHVNHRVQRFWIDGTFRGSFGTAGTGPGEFRLPWGAAAGPDGLLWIADWGNDRLQAFDDDGVCRTVIGGPGSALLRRPSGLTVTTDGLLVVCDWGNDRVVVLRPDPVEVVDVWHGAATLSPWARQQLEDLPVVQRLREHSRTTTVERWFRRPTGVASVGNHVYVADTGRHRLQVYAAVG